METLDLSMIRFFIRWIESQNILKGVAKRGGGVLKSYRKVVNRLTTLT